MDELSDVLNGIKSTSLLVVGDCILDVYHRGVIKNSVESSALKVFDTFEIIYSLGGAANVAANCASLGADTTLVGVSDMSLNGSMLQTKLVEQSGVLSIHANVLGSYSRSWKTPVKTRYFINDELVFRADSESSENKIPQADVMEIRKRIKILLQKRSYDLIVVADYNKGTIDPAIYADCVNSRIPVVVDPKGGDFFKYKSCYVIKPNRMEAENATGGKDLLLAVQEIKRITGANVVATDGDSDAICLEGKNDPYRISVNRVNNPYVIGAGDSTLAGLACALAGGSLLREAVEFAMTVGEASVKEFGTTVVDPLTFKEVVISH